MQPSASSVAPSTRFTRPSATAFSCWQELRLAEVRFLPTAARHIGAAVRDPSGDCRWCGAVRISRSSWSMTAKCAAAAFRIGGHADGAAAGNIRRLVCLLLGWMRFSACPTGTLARAADAGAYRGGSPPGVRAPTPVPWARSWSITAPAAIRVLHEKPSGCACTCIRDSAGDFLDRAAFPPSSRPRPAGLPQSRRVRQTSSRRGWLACTAEPPAAEGWFQENSLKHISPHTPAAPREERASPLQTLVTAALR